MWCVRYHTMFIFPSMREHHAPRSSKSITSSYPPPPFHVFFHDIQELTALATRAIIRLLNPTKTAKTASINPTTTITAKNTPLSAPASSPLSPIPCPSCNPINKITAAVHPVNALLLLPSPVPSAYCSQKNPVRSQLSTTVPTSRLLNSAAIVNAFARTVDGPMRDNPISLNRSTANTLRLIHTAPHQ